MLLSGKCLVGNGPLKVPSVLISCVFIEKNFNFLAIFRGVLDHSHFLSLSV